MIVSTYEACPNFRDAGEVVNVLADSPLMREGVLLRGGKLDFISSLHDVRNPRSILNLRRGPDPDFGVYYVHHPARDDVENYDVSNRIVRRWVLDALEVLAGPGLPLPVIVHCASGRDRTGVVVASLLLAIGVPQEIVRDEYLFSDGAKEDYFDLYLAGSPAVISKLSPATCTQLRSRFGMEK